MNSLSIRNVQRTFQSKIHKESASSWSYYVTSSLFNKNKLSRQFLKYGLSEYLRPVCVFKTKFDRTMTPSFISIYTRTMTPEGNIRSDSANFNSNQVLMDIPYTNCQIASHKFVITKPIIPCTQFTISGRSNLAFYRTYLLRIGNFSHDQEINYQIKTAGVLWHTHCKHFTVFRSLQRI